MRRSAVFCLFLLSTASFADEAVPICYGYSCAAQAEIHYSAPQLEEIRHLLASASDPASERERLADAVGRLYRWAGEQSDIHNDRAGNYADAGVPGRMDCIDHSTSTTRLIALLEGQGLLRWHHGLERQPRRFLGLMINHWSAVIEETPVPAGGEARRFAVDSWFVNNGEPAVILPLDAWKKGAGPDV